MSEHIFETSDSDEGLAVYVTSTMGITGAEPREEIVRCRECKQSVCTNGDWICRLFYRLYGDPVYIESWGMHEVDPDGFCAWAERREA